jgi:predicted transglutaminase-like cysteine proteinase
MLGVPEERLRVAIVHDNLKNIAHAILIVYTDGGAIILDNQEKSVLDGQRAGRYRPIYSINRTAWWLHTADIETRVASR